MTERTFLDPIHDGVLLIEDVRSDLDDIAIACNSLGMIQLKSRMSRMSHMIDDLLKARQLIDEGRDMALKSVVGGAEQATVNMINAAISGGAQEEAAP